ncbi:DUF2627 family protein [Halobacillus salinarum]|uniref:DUF2627 family protein n=1 Tax=Halobacillus salinarum TaxID=2932257 RepID=UPI0029621CBF|nr:DUF2627 family protein [Halobacillus salinarum]
MRDALFGIFHPIFLHIVIQGFAGFLLLIGGIGFIGGYILHRDKKRNLTKGRFKQK